MWSHVVYTCVHYYLALCLTQAGWTLLHIAVKHCSEDVVKMMIERGADIHAVDEVSP